MRLLRWIGLGMRSAGRVAGGAASALVGNVAWTPPVWVKDARCLLQGGSGWAAFCFVALFAGVAWFQAWKEIQPVPEVVTSLVYPPAIPNLSDTPVDPNPVVIEFSKPVAPLDMANRPVEGISITPEIGGSWIWRGDRKLVFKPDRHWPAATTYSIRLPEVLLRKKTVLANEVTIFRTKPFEAALQGLEVHLDPRDPSRRELLATVRFTHPVEAAALREALVFETTGGSAVFGGQSRAKEPAVKLTRQGRLAFINAGVMDLPSRDDFIKLLLSKKFRTAAGESGLLNDLTETIRIASAANFFQIEGVTYQMVRNDEGAPEQIIVVETSSEAKAGALDRFISAKLLPAPPEEESQEEEESVEDTEREDQSAQLPEPKTWQSISAIPAEILKKGDDLALMPIPPADELTKFHSYRVKLPPGGNVLISVAPGAAGFGGFKLREEYAGFIYVKCVPSEIELVTPGAVLALSGEKKISIKTRRLPAAMVEICRVFPDELNHLVSQTRGEFAYPEFQNWRFSQDNISMIRRQVIAVGGEGDAEARYLSFDFTAELQKAEPRLNGGVFILRLFGWDPVREKRISEIAKQLVLVTDLGIIVKRSADGRRDVFIQSLAKGEPMAGVEVTVLAKNGQPVEHATTDAGGRAVLPSTDSLRRENAPVAILARNGDDVAFLPFDRDDRIVDISNFDVSGVELAKPEDLQTFGFTERGVYRPGDPVHLSVYLKRRDWTPLPDGMPIRMEIFDARSRSVFLEKRNLSNPALAEFSFETSAVSPTGTYVYEVFVGDGQKEREVLWSDTFRVEEFEPDRMKLEVSLASARRKGWMHLDELEFTARLQHLFGASAAGCRIKGAFNVTPWAPDFDAYQGWNFYMPGERRLPTGYQQVTLESVTDEEGVSKAALEQESFPSMGLWITVNTEGFEPDGGRSVGGRDSMPVAPFDYLIGWKTDQNLSFLTKDLPCSLNILAVDPDLHPKEVKELQVRIVEIRQVSSLIRLESGAYAYRSVPKELLVQERPLQLEAGETALELPTRETGDFRVAILSDAGRPVLLVNYHVSGKGNPSVALEKSAEITAALSTATPQPGEWVTLNLTTPYTGAGLITIEREGIVAHQWFKADATSTVHAIQIPESFEGTGYISVSMLRGLDSEEIFTSPHTYCIVPFEVIPKQREAALTLELAEKIRPGETLKIRTRADRACKVVVFAVDEGILQVSDYQTPQPLQAMFEKRRLLVETSQIIDQLMPEFSLLAKQSAFGGDGEEKLAKNLNPFTRVTEKPVVYWSGIIETGPGGNECSYEVPDFFDGALRVMAVAFAADGVASRDKMVRVAGPYVLQPSAPLAVAPGDEIIATVHVTRLADDFPAEEATEILCEPSEHWKISGSRNHRKTLAPGKDAVVEFRLQALDKLGAAEVRFTARGGGHTSSRRRTISVRPVSPYVTHVRAANYSSDGAAVELTPNLRPEYLKRRVVLSATPLSLAIGLGEYLSEFPHGCTEQTTSKAFCRLLLAENQEFGLPREVAAKHVEAALQILRTRQANNGAFGLWQAPSDEPRADWLSCYVVDFFTEAKAGGFDIPADLLTRANQHLEKVAGAAPNSMEEARAVAYAVYLLTRQGIVTTNFLLHLRDRLAAGFEPRWRNDLAAIYVAGAHALLLQRSEARALFQGFKKGEFSGTGDFYHRLTHESRYLTLIIRHDSDLLKESGQDAFERIIGEIESGRFNTLSGAYAVQALRAMSAYVQNSQVALGAKVFDHRNQTLGLPLSGLTMLQGVLPAAASRVTFQFDPGRTAGIKKAYYQVVESGFPDRAPAQPVNKGIETVRLLHLGRITNPGTIALGEEMEVCVRLRSSSGTKISNVAIVDLFPAGFELVKGDIEPGAGSLGFDYVDVREDRVVFYGDIGTNYREIRYRLKAISRGRFQVPPVSAASMYDRGVAGISTGRTIEVQEKGR